jgi:hypothetical protein
MLRHSCRIRLGMFGLLLASGCGGDPTDVQIPDRPDAPGFLSDLSPVGIEAPREVRLDSLLRLSVAVHNAGARTAGPGWFVRLFLSADSLITADDILIDQFVATRELPGGVDDRYLRTMKLPGRTEPSTYYLGSMLDVTGIVPETDEENNALVSPPTIIILPRTQPPTGDD